MRTPRTPQAPARRALWLAALLLTLAGLVAMHGLSGHGLPGGSHGTALVVAGHAVPPLTDPGTTRPAVTTMPEPGHGTADVSSADVPAVPATVTTAATTVRNASIEHDGLMAMCVAILAAAIVALLRRLAAAQAATGLARTGEPTGTWAELRGRDRDPPSLTVLSIQRC